MPHILIQGEPDLAALFGALQPITEYRGNGVLKTRDAFISRDQHAVVVDAVATEDSTSRTFFALVILHEDGLMIRIHPTTEVEHTNGVKRILAAIADHLISLDPSLEVGETNLEPYMTGSGLARG